VVEELIVKWPDGKVHNLKQVPVNQLLSLDYSKASPGTTTVVVAEMAPQNQLFDEVSTALGIDFIHQEADKIDYNLQRTLPHKLSQFGPALQLGT
jgi:hypothetical protein